MFNTDANKTLLNLLDTWAIERSHHIAFTFLDGQGIELQQVTFRELRQNSLAIASKIYSRTETNQRAILFFHSGLEFIYAFLGCLYAGVIAVPIPPPQGKRQISRFNSILNNVSPHFILSTQSIQSHLSKQEFSLSLSQIKWINVENLAFNQFEENLPCIKADQLAFLQYTSGSTSTPKGVMISHRNLMHNEAMITEGFQHSDRTKVMGWLPFYHDMGLIGNILHPIYLGITSTLMSPTSFIQNPLLWLKSISKYQITTSGGPNFAYQHCIDRISINQLTDVNLACWKIAFNGSEMIHADTLYDFCKKFSQFGFQPESFYPCYGLAENTLFATGVKIGHFPRILDLKKQLNKKQPIVSCGFPHLDQTVKVINIETKEECQEGEIGEVWLKGPSVANGYWKLFNENEEVFNASIQHGECAYLKTGDLGFIDSGELFITGRLKNLIIIRGKNFYPDDIEQVIQKSHPIFTGKVGAAFSILEGAEEKLIFFQEIDRSTIKKYDLFTVIKQIKKTLTEEFLLDLHAIIFVSLNSIPRTTSGKIQYHICRKNFLEKSFSSLFEWHAKDDQEQQTSKIINHQNNCKNSSEKQIALYAASLLNLSPEEICFKEPLIHYGFDSIKAIKLISWLKQTFDFSWELEALFEGASIEEIGKKIKFSPFKMSDKQDISPTDQQKNQPLSPNQENLWTIHQFNPTSTAYNIPIVLKFTGILSQEAFKEALSDLMSRHSMLRVTIEKENDKPIQKMWENWHVPLFQENISHYLEEEKVTYLNQAIENESFRSFNFEDEFLFRIKLISFSSHLTFALMNFHHIICDGWSMHIFIDDLRFAYESRLLGHKPQWKSTAISNCHYKEAIKNDISYSQAKTFWSNYLKGDLPILTLSPLHLHPKQPRDQGACQVIHISGHLLDKLKDFNKQNKSTLAITLCAAFHVLLHLYSNQEQILVGYPSANRLNVDQQNIFGYFVNTLVSKTNFHSTITFKDVIRQVKIGILEGIKHESLPFQEILKIIQPPRREGITPIFQAMFVMQNAPTDITGFPNLEVEIMNQSRLPVFYDLVLEVAELANNLKLSFEYKLDCLNDVFINQFSQHYEKLLELVLNEPQENLQTLNYLDSAENFEFEETDFEKLERTRYSSVIQLFEHQVYLRPDAIAVKSDTGWLSYKELNEKANGIAQNLIKNGLRAEESVGFYLDRCPDLIACLLGIAKAGGVYVPLDPSYPQERIQFMIEDAGIRFLIIEEQYYKNFTFFNGQILDIRFIYPIEHFVNRCQNPHSLAYILYTSGSTGKPKGVMVEHRSLLNFTLEATKLFELTPQDCVLQFSSISWDTSSEEIYPCLTTGATLVLKSHSPVESFDDLMQRAEKYHLTIWDLPTSYWHDLSDYLISQKKQLPSTLRLIIVGGEKISRNKVEKWNAYYNNKVKLLNTYGATEATSISTSFDLYEWKKEYKDAPIGKPIGNVKAYILNNELQPVPVGVVGYLYLGGIGLARGYRHLTELTNQKFINHPQWNKRLYCTGDMGYKMTDGNILIQGRNDHQIKRRGFRIELEEIQAALNQIKWINKNLVIKREKELSEESTLVAYIVLSEDGQKMLASGNLIEKIKDCLHEHLPSYMMPDEFKWLTDFPRLPNGKLDYQSLDTQAISLITSSIQLEILSETEKKLMNIWTDILSLSQFNKKESFFDVGGNSLLIIKLHHRICEAFSIQVNISDLFKYSSFESQIKMIDHLTSNLSNKPLDSLALLKQLEQGEIDLETAKKLLTQTSR